MSKPVLIVGGGPAGLAAAHSLATVGKESIIVEKENELGGAPILSGYAKLVPSGEWAKDAIGGMVSRVADEATVSVETGTTVASFDGEPGNFSVACLPRSCNRTTCSRTRSLNRAERNAAIASGASSDGGGVNRKARISPVTPVTA